MNRRLSGVGLAAALGLPRIAHAAPAGAQASPAAGDFPTLTMNLTDTAIEFPHRVVAVVGVGAGLGGFDGESTPEEVALFQQMEALEEAATPDPDAIADIDVRVWVDGPGQPVTRVPAEIRTELGHRLVLLDGRAPLLWHGGGHIEPGTATGRGQHGRDDDGVVLEHLANLAAPLGTGVRGIGVRRGGADLDAIVADPSNPLDRLL